MKDEALSKKQVLAFHQKIQNVVKGERQSSMDLCMVVYESDTQMTRVDGELVFCWKVWGYNSWEDFVGQELDLHLTTAYAFKKVWEVFYVTLNGAWSQDLLLGITKMRILSCAKLTPKNVGAQLKKAAKMNCRELRHYVFGSDESHSFTTSVSESELNRINRILKKGRDIYGEDLPRGQLLVSILRDWDAAQKKARHLHAA